MLKTVDYPVNRDDVMTEVHRATRILFGIMYILGAASNIIFKRRKSCVLCNKSERPEENLRGSKILWEWFAFDVLNVFWNINIRSCRSPTLTAFLRIIIIIQWLY